MDPVSQWHKNRCDALNTILRTLVVTTGPSIWLKVAEVCREWKKWHRVVKKDQKMQGQEQRRRCLWYNKQGSFFPLFSPIGKLEVQN